MLSMDHPQAVLGIRRTPAQRKADEKVCMSAEMLKDHHQRFPGHCGPGLPWPGHCGCDWTWHQPRDGSRADMMVAKSAAPAAPLKQHFYSAQCHNTARSFMNHKSLSTAGHLWLRLGASHQTTASSVSCLEHLSRCTTTTPMRHCRA